MCGGGGGGGVVFTFPLRILCSGDSIKKKTPLGKRA